MKTQNAPRVKFGKPAPMTEAQIEAAAQAAPDARPMTDAEFAVARRVPRVKIVRRALWLTQEQFAAQYQNPLGTLRDWEQNAAAPDATAKAYIRAIAGGPAGVLRALSAVPTAK